jgi:excisionase family DNA binding protein
LVDRAETEESFLTVAEVAEMLKLNQQTVRNWIDQGSLPALRVGRRVRIKRSDFDRILEEAYSGQSAQAAGDPAPAPQAPAVDQTAPAGPTPSAEDFWGGEPVGIPEPAPSIGAAPSNLHNGLSD